MKKISIFLIGTVILCPLVCYILTAESVLCQILASLIILTIIFVGDKKDRMFWKEYFSCFKILFPLPKEYDK